MSSEKPVRWGVMGTARIAERVAPAIQAAESAQLLAVASRSQDRADQWAAQHGVARAYGSYEALLDDAEIDAVYIPLPPSMHAEWTIRAAEAGKHVLCEKPLAESTSRAVEMADACREHGVQLMDGVMWYHHPRAAQMREVVASGQLGELRRVTSAFSFNWDVVPEEDFRLRREMGGGSLLDLGWYCVGAALWALDALPRAVYGTARWYRDVDMNFSGLMWFDGPVMSAFDSGFDTVMRKWLEVAGRQASLVCDDFTRPRNPERPRYWIHRPEGESQEFVADTPAQEVCMIEDFCACVRSGKPDPTWPQRAVDTQRICEALDRSARTGQVVELG